MPSPAPWGPPPWPPPGAVPWGAPPVRPVLAADRPYARAPHSEPEPYPRLLRTPWWSWWRPVLGVLLGVAVLAVLGIGVVVAASLAEAVRTGSLPAESALQDFSDPLVLLANNLLLAALIPAALLAVLVVHRERPSWLFSVVGRLRWGLLWRFALLAVGTTLLGGALGSLLPGLDTTGDGGGTVDGGRLAAQLAVIALTTPLQAAGEEFGFRGYLTQAIAGYGRSRLAGPLVAGLVTSLLFALAHGGQAPLLFADRFAFGALAAWLVWRTGGLEAPIALHTVNNLLALGSAALAGALSQSLDATDMPWQAFVVDVGSLLLFAALADRWARRRAAARLSTPAPATLEVAPPIG